MLDLAISCEQDRNGRTLIETNGGQSLKVPNWPLDSDFHLIAFEGKTGEVVAADDVATDIGRAIAALHISGFFKDGAPDWYHRLERYASGCELT